MLLHSSSLSTTPDPQATPATRGFVNSRFDALREELRKEIGLVDAKAERALHEAAAATTLMRTARALLPLPPARLRVGERPDSDIPLWFSLLQATKAHVRIDVLDTRVDGIEAKAEKERKEREEKDKEARRRSAEKTKAIEQLQVLATSSTAESVSPI